jgi:hypothetical protein
MCLAGSNGNGKHTQTFGTKHHGGSIFQLGGARLKTFDQLFWFVFFVYFRWHHESAPSRQRPICPPGTP